MRLLNRPIHRRWLTVKLVFIFTTLLVPSAFAQVSPEEHAEHHPEKAAGNSEQGSGMMGGNMMGGMGDMMEKMGAPKPKELYPRLMDLPDLPMEERREIKQEAHARMLEGTRRFSDGLDELAAAASTDDFQAMQNATAKMREGLAQFESGLAAHRAIAEGKAPRNVALQWFKREMGLLPDDAADHGFRLFGMTAFHTAIMTVLIAFAAAMIWMYFLKMRRATDLMKQLAEAASSNNQQDLTSVSSAENEPTLPSETAPAGVAVATSSDEDLTHQADCCNESSTDCSSAELVKGADISTGILQVAKRKLCRLRVARIFRETTDVKTFRLVACHGGGLPFSYLPGQFLTLTLPVGEKPIRRSYTISSSPTQGYYCEISVKREDLGAGSRYLHDQLKEGDTLEVQAPSGKFTFTGSEADSIVLISGGVGITPMMSITRALTDMSWEKDIYFVIACRDPDHFIFRSDLLRLQECNPKLHVFVSMSRVEEPIDGWFPGRLTKERLAEWVPDIADKWIHLCGAPPMMEATQQMLAELGVSAGKIHTENFGSQQKPHVKTTQREESNNSTKVNLETTASVTFAASQKSTQMLPEETVLEAAEREGVEIDSSCRTGMCGVCRVKLTAGRVTMDVDDALEPDDKAADMILACQAKSTGDITVEA